MTLEDSDFFQKVVLKTPDKFTDEDRPRVSLHLLLKNAESVIQRLLDNVGPYVAEIVCVLNDTTDRTREILEEWGRSTGKRVDITPVTYETHPELYIVDTYETYAAGRSLCGENIGGPFMEKPILADWSSIRNIAWERCECDWRLFLDADDVVEDPHSIWGLIEALEENNCDFALSKYYWNVDEEGRARGASYRERLARNNPEIRWMFPIHEVLYGYRKHAYVDGNLRVLDKRDSKGEGIRIPGRNFKILYHYGRSNDWDVPPRILIQLAEAGNAMSDFVRRALDLYLERSTWPEERGWALCLMGETYEAEGNYAEASRFYESALGEHPGSKAAYRLARTRYHEGKWQACLDAYKRGTENEAALQILDDGPLYKEMTYFLVADAYWRLGDLARGLEFATLAKKAFPNNSAGVEMHERMAAGTFTPVPWPPPPETPNEDPFSLLEGEDDDDDEDDVDVGRKEGP